MKPIFKLENQTGREGLYFEKKSHSYREYDEISQKSDVQFSFKIVIMSLLKKLNMGIDLNNSQCEKMMKIFKSCYCRMIYEKKIHHYELKPQCDFILMKYFNIPMKYDEKFFRTVGKMYIHYLIMKDIVKFDEKERIKDIFKKFVKSNLIGEHNRQYMKEKNIGI